MDYETFGSKAHRGERMHSDSSNTSSNSREVNVFHSVVRTVDSPFGKLRVPSDLEKIEIAFLVLGTLSTLGVIAMTIYRLTNTIDDSDSTFALVLLVNSVFCLGYIYHGVFGERPYQLWAFMIAIISVAVYSIIQISSKRSTLLLVRLIVLLVLGPIDLILCFKISMQHYTSKNLIIRTLRSANIQFQNMCMNMFIFQTLLIFEFETALSLIVLVLTSGLEDAHRGEIVILVVGIFVGILWLIVGYLVPKYENNKLVAAFLILSLPQPAYVLYKIIKTAKDWDNEDDTINISIIACACLFFVTRCLVFFYLWIVVHNFGKGLRAAVYFPEEEEERPPEEVQQAPPPEPDDNYLGENVNDDVHN